MADPDDLKLNSLERYRKTSQRLALEVHSHCEVPAGCGGVVLRWRGPDDDVGLSLWHHVRGTTRRVLLDGAPVGEQRVRVRPGAHVLALELEVSAPDTGFLLLRVSLEPAVPTARQPSTGTRAGAGWGATAVPPPDGWQLPGFEDASLVALEEQPVPRPDAEGRWRWDPLQEQARGLALPRSALAAPGWDAFLPGHPLPLWVRWEFRVDAGGVFP
jgi:hypothetical protein